LGGFKAKKMAITLPPHCRRYAVQVTDENGATVMRYERKTQGGQDVFHLPSAYYQHIETERWHIAFTPLPDIAFVKEN
jgi:hypothetical protein